MGIIILEFHNDLLNKTTKEYFYNLESARATAKRLKRGGKASNIRIYSLINGHQYEMGVE